ncbi:hypothetical protein B0T25DRAFT_562565 [Lasiosphaeria hispida]|uniref:Mid2 domain-containing protein n=1 Tax=Lasiosphaeria hispida TaxID=260671 RepID=A0AAJ0HVB5_9PEZI|nr:hypothetical protein B0T25DRAFT_562565 [Lasiosphaeria hispida]
MHCGRILDLLAIGLSVMTVAEAAFIDPRLAGQNGVAIQRRQETGDGSVSAAATSTTTTPPPTTASTTSTTTRSTTAPPTQPTSTPPPPPDSTSTPQPPSSTPPPPATSPTPSPTNSPGNSDPPEQSPVVETITQVITTTNSDGVQTTFTTKATTTSTPGLANNNNNGAQEAGMSTQTRNTVIGVVVGVGGAIVLCGLAFVAWRIWGRKKIPDENDNLMDYGSTAEKPDTGNSMSGRTPFQSTLESYHAPTQVNTASNF